MKVFFIGAFNEISNNMSRNSSVAGSKVQMEIISSLNDFYGESNVRCAVFPELASWPKNNIFIKKSTFGNVLSLFIINLPIIKRFIFSIQVLYLIAKYKPRYILQYNTTFLMNFFMFFYKFFCIKRVLILQDLNSRVSFNIRLLLSPISLLNYLGAKTIRYSFDFFIPISHFLIKDLNLPIEKSFVCQGGVTTLENKKNNFLIKKRIAVFAGALEEYNGVDLLVSRWDSLSIDMELHIFGVGSLTDLVLMYSKYNVSIKYHGFQSPEVVDSFVDSALFNFCLRYSKGIDQNYFFPSKFFDLLLKQGNLVCNNFNNIPKDLNDYIFFLKDDLSNLNEILLYKSQDNADILDRIHYMNEKYSWSYVLNGIFKDL